MSYFILKTVFTALLIAAISELSKRFTFLSSLLAALPVTSVLLFFWIYFEQRDLEKIALISEEIFYLVVPSLAFFLIFSLLLKRQFGFGISMLISCVTTFVIYVGYLKMLKAFGKSFS